MTPFLLLLLLLGSLFPVFVSAHGYVGSVTIDGQSYPGNQPGGTTSASVIRQISTISPVKGATNPSINCGMNATLAADVANANPGSNVQVHWVGGATGSSNWEHSVGPIMHYMTKCTGSCSSYDSTNAEWFKVSELGVESNNSTWYMADLVAGMPANVTIPDVTPGGYLLRTELISLQNGMSPGGAEFYVACIQLNIGGSGTSTANSNEECTFPGGYSDSDPGILFPGVYNPPITYVFPGPPMPAFVGSGGSEGGTTGTTGGSSTTPTASSNTPTPSASGDVTASTDTSSPSLLATTLPTTASITAPTTIPSATRSVNSLTSGKTCYVRSSSDPLLAKRGDQKKQTHRRRLVRRGLA